MNIKVGEIFKVKEDGGVFSAYRNNPDGSHYYVFNNTGKRIEFVTIHPLTFFIIVNSITVTNLNFESNLTKKYIGYIPDTNEFFEFYENSHFTEYIVKISHD